MSKIIVGLGNPGDSYANTRHNAGFWLIDALAAKRGAAFSFKKKFNADIAVVGDLKLLKPQTFMNNSGAAVVAVAAFYQIRAADILVAHDEVDFPAGVVKLKFGGGAAGHNGIKDISRCLGGDSYWRLRLGVGKPAVGGVENYVLQTPPPPQRERIDAAITRALAVYADIVADDYNTAMQKLHGDNTGDNTGVADA